MFLSPKQEQGIKHTAVFLNAVRGWRGEASVYKLSYPLQDYEYVVCNSLVTSHAGHWNTKIVGETCIFGAVDEQGTVLEMAVLSKQENLSHTETLLAAGYLVITESCEGIEIHAFVDSWQVEGIHIHSETGIRFQYEVARTGKNIWTCTCPPWKARFAKKEKFDCTHIKTKKEELTKLGIVFDQNVKEDKNDRALRLED